MDFFSNGFDTEQLHGLAVEYGINIIAALLIFTLGRWAAQIATGLIRKAMKKARMDKILVSFLGNIVYFLSLGFVIIAALSKLGVETTSLAAIFAAAGLAIGLAFQSSLSNFAAGVMIVAFRPFRIGNYIEAAGTAGTVDDISIFTTTLKTPDNKKIIVPNNEITSGTVTNFSANPTRRIDMVFGCGYDDDLKKVKKVLTDVVVSDERVLDAPELTIAVSELADSSVNFVVRPWVKTEDYWATRFDLTEKIKEAFDKEGLSIPYPQQDVHMRQVAEPTKGKKKAG